MLDWIRRRLKKSPAPENDPKEPAYWLARGRKYGNTLAVAYRWGQIDEEGNPLPEPHVSRE